MLFQFILFINIITNCIHIIFTFSYLMWILNIFSLWLQLSTLSTITDNPTFSFETTPKWIFSAIVMFYSMYLFNFLFLVSPDKLFTWAWLAFIDFLFFKNLITTLWEDKLSVAYISQSEFGLLQTSPLNQWSCFSKM